MPGSCSRKKAPCLPTRRTTTPRASSTLQFVARPTSSCCATGSQPRVDDHRDKGRGPPMVRAPSCRGIFMRHLKSATALLAALAFAACATAPKGPPPLAAGDYAAILADPARTEADKNDDAARKPAEVLAFAQIRPGDTILEMEAGRGWYSDIISGAVGPAGKLIVQYPPEFAYGDPAFKARTDAGRLANATITRTHFDTLEADDASVDKVLWILGPHEVYYTPANTQGLGDPAKTYAEIVRVLKPGGEFIAMDHSATPGAPTTTGQ